MEKIIQEKEFNHKGQNYIVKVFASDAGIRVRAFIDSKPANRFTYSMGWDTQHDFETIIGFPGINMLIEGAIADVKKLNP